MQQSRRRYATRRSQLQVRRIRPQMDLSSGALCQHHVCAANVFLECQISSAVAGVPFDGANDDAGYAGIFDNDTRRALISHFDVLVTLKNRSGHIEVDILANRSLRFTYHDGKNPTTRLRQAKSMRR